MGEDESKQRKSPRIATKVRVPSVPESRLHRLRLLATLRAGKGCRVAIIHAPAGYGKTTLAAQWGHELALDGHAVAWLSLDEGDNDPERFLAYLIESLRVVEPSVSEGLISLLESQSSHAVTFVLAELVNELEQLKRDLVVVFDDWHLITRQEVVDAVEFLIHRAPANFRVVVTSRTRPSFPTARLKVAGQLAEVTSADLRFDFDESSEFLRELDMQREDLEVLQRTTEGWAAAMQLALIYLRVTGLPGGLTSWVSGAHYSIGEYLAENVLNSLPPELLDFLLKTAVLRRLCGPLCAAVSAYPNSQQFLERLEALDLFLVPLDDERRWFRYHHLFASQLKKRLLRDHPHLVPALDAAASRWFEEQGDTEEAVSHALAAGDAERAAQLVERVAMSLVEHSSMTTLLGLVQKLPPEAMAGRIALQTAVAWSNCLIHRPAEAYKVLADIEQHLVNCEPARRDDVESETKVIRACIAIYGDETAGVAELIDPILAAYRNVRPWVVAVAANIKSFLFVQSFEFEAAVRLQKWANQFHSRTEGPFSGIYGRCFAGIASFHLGAIDEAEAYYLDALDMARRTAGRQSHAARLAAALLGQVCYVRNARDDAEVLLEESLALGIEGGVADFSLATHVCHARAKFQIGEIEAAFQSIEKGRRIAAQLDIGRLLAIVIAEEVRLQLQRGNVHRAEALVRVLDCEDAPPESMEDGIAAQVWEFKRLAGCRLQLAKGEYRPALEGLTLLLERAEATRRRFFALELKIVLALACELDGDRAQAEKVMAAALREGAAQRVVRPFLDEDGRIMPLVERVARNREAADDASDDFVRGVISIYYAKDSAVAVDEMEFAAPAGGQGAGAKPPALIEPLKDREIQILKLLDLGKANKEIARQLGMSVDTVKWYLKSIFGKMGVGRRTQAIAEARRIGVIK